MSNICKICSTALAFYIFINIWMHPHTSTHPHKPAYIHIKKAMKEYIHGGRVGIGNYSKRFHFICYFKHKIWQENPCINPYNKNKLI